MAGTWGSSAPFRKAHCPSTPSQTEIHNQAGTARRRICRRTSICRKPVLRNPNRRQPSQGNLRTRCECTWRIRTSRRGLHTCHNRSSTLYTCGRHERRRRQACRARALSRKRTALPVPSAASVPCAAAALVLQSQALVPPAPAVLQAPAQVPPAQPVPPAQQPRHPARPS